MDPETVPRKLPKRPDGPATPPRGLSNTEQSELHPQYEKRPSGPIKVGLRRRRPNNPMALNPTSTATKTSTPQHSDLLRDAFSKSSTLNSVKPCSLGCIGPCSHQLGSVVQNMMVGTLRNLFEQSNDCLKKCGSLIEQLQRVVDALQKQRERISNGHYLDSATRQELSIIYGSTASFAGDCQSISNLMAQCLHTENCVDRFCSSIERQQSTANNQQPAQPTDALDQQTAQPTDALVQSAQQTTANN